VTGQSFELLLSFYLQLFVAMLLLGNRVMSENVVAAADGASFSFHALNVVLLNFANVAFSIQ